MNDFVLSTQQLAVICALSSGATMTDAAEQAGVHRNTIANWRRNTLPFQYALAHAQYDRALLFREKSEALADLAIGAIQAILTDPKAPASVRLKAALAILQTVSTPPEPKRQLLLEFEKIKVVDNPQPQTLVHKDAQSETGVDPRPSAAPVPDPQIVHNSAQPVQPIRPEPRIAPTKIGRNDACPCGSGKKYKRCCLDSPLSQPLAAAA
jgi:hypothetical protein